MGNRNVTAIFSQRSVNMIFKKKNEEPIEIMLINEIIPSKNITQFFFNTASTGRLKKLDTINKEGLRICTEAFRTSPVESLHVEADYPPWN